VSGSGKVYLLGAGPGDPELITVRALRRLREADLVLYDALAHPDLLRHCRPDAELVYVGKRAGRASERQADINARMLDAARAGRCVARLKGGDPYLFGRGSEEAEVLAAAGIEIEVVPGVPSPLAAAAYTGITLSHRELASSVAYLTATESEQKDQSSHDWSKLATGVQTLVIFMGVRKLESLMELLIAHGRAPDCPAAVVQSASLPAQRTVVATVATIAAAARDAGLGMPALTIVGEVVRLREPLRWYDVKPLFGKRVLVTRPIDQLAGMAQLLRDAGAEPIAWPALRIAPPEDPRPLRDAVARVGDYDFVVFTSANGVAAFFAELKAQGGDSRWLGRAKLAAIGPATRDALAVHGLSADAMPDEYVGEGAAQAVLALAGGDLRGRTVLLPRALVARDALPAALHGAGAHVDVVPAYRALPPDAAAAETLRDMVRARALDAIAFTSSSTVDNTIAALGPDARSLLAGLTLASIGPITSKTAEQHGLRIAVSASPYTTEGLVAALERHYHHQEQQPS
jgi:uroporphyrinogen III methyltransferase/synthase